MRWIWLGGLLLATPAVAQDTLRLGGPQQAAVERDPRARQLMLQEAATDLRLRNLAAERLPTVAVGARAGYQSEVPGIPLDLPGGIAIPEPPKDRYEATVDVRQTLYEGGVLDRRRSLEEAERHASRARLAAALYPLRTEVNQALSSAIHCAHPGMLWIGVKRPLISR